jgi:DNA invertase Pin-like site-specific DNA recombinase
MRKAIVYIRTSTKEQNPELQREDCLNFCKEKELEVQEIVSEQGSAYSNTFVRVEWEKLVKKAQQDKLDIVVWRYDRAFRNKEKFFTFMKVMFEVYKVKIYSVKEPSILSFWNMIDNKHSDNPVFNELMNNLFKAFWDFMIQQAGEEAEEEAKKISERIKLAIIKEKANDKNEKPITLSYKGKKWGNHSISEKEFKGEKVDEKIIQLNKQGKSIRQICKEVQYWDKNGNPRFVSLGYVFKVLKQDNNTL